MQQVGVNINYIPPQWSIDGVPVILMSSVRNLGIFFDTDLVLWTHVHRTVSRGFAVLRQLCHIGRSVPTATFQTLVVALVLSRLDYGNGVMVGLPTHLVRRLQSVQNAAARLIYGASIMLLMRSLACIGCASQSASSIRSPY